MSDPVNHPDYYGDEEDLYEVIKVLEAWDLQLARGFCWGNVIKYTARASKKGNAVQDRQKAEWYANRLTTIEAQLAGQGMTQADEPDDDLDDLDVFDSDDPVTVPVHLLKWDGSLEGSETVYVTSPDTLVIQAARAAWSTFKFKNPGTNLPDRRVRTLATTVKSNVFGIWIVTRVLDPEAKAVDEWNSLNLGEILTVVFE